MSTRRNHMFLALLLISAMAIMVPQNVLAAGTAAGTTISNQATVNYQVGGVSQAAINSAAISFVVDNRVNVTVAQLGNATVVPGSTNQVLSFSVTNFGNTAQSYALSATYNGGTMTMNNVRIYRDVNANGTYEAGTDTPYVDATTFGSIAADGVLRVLIVADTPGTATNGQTAVYNLIATTTNAGTTTVTTQTAGPDTAGIDVVFGDIAGSAAGDVARDGRHSTTATYTVSAATLTVTKTSAIYSDPFNGTTNPKAIPNAIITYTLTIANAAGGAQATAVVITDSLATEITAGHLAFRAQFDDGTGLGCTGVQGIAVDPGTGTYACRTNTNDGDNADWNLSAGNTVTVNVPTLNAGATARIKFQVVVQ